MPRTGTSCGSEPTEGCFKVQMGLSMRVMQQLLLRISAAENLQVSALLELSPVCFTAGDARADCQRVIRF